jgi:hypothetical protein
MPRYRFQWTNLSPELIEKLAAGLKLEGDAVDALIDRYGSRPKPAFLQDAWSILLDSWLSNDPVAAKQLAIALKERSLGDVGIEDDITYLKSCRNTSGLREVVIEAFHARGEEATNLDQETTNISTEAKDDNILVVESVQDNNDKDDWPQFRDLLIAFLKSYSAETTDTELMSFADKLYSLCPRGRTRNDDGASAAIIEGLTQEMECSLFSATSALTTFHNRRAEDSAESADRSAFFFVGMCQNASDYDKRFEILEHYIESGDFWSIDGVISNKDVENVFEADVFYSLLVWEDLEDWARAMLVMRDEVGITTEDKSDFVLGYLGTHSLLGGETLEAICKDISVKDRGYSDQTIHVLKSFLGGNFEPAQRENHRAIEELEEHFNSLNKFKIEACRNILGGGSP